MNGVDRFDQYCKNYDMDYKSRRWTFKISMFLIRVLIHNSYILFKLKYCGNSKDKNLHRKFIFSVIKWFCIGVSEKINVAEAEKEIEESDENSDMTSNDCVISFETKRGVVYIEKMHCMKLVTQQAAMCN